MRFLFAAVCLVLSGCHGPLSGPVVRRLDVEAQSKVEDAWTNMLTPPDRLDRLTLLDAIMLGQLHQDGVDSLRFLSEKRVSDGTVVMEIRYDRDDPAAEEYSITYVDSTGSEIRRERYLREEIEQEWMNLFSWARIDENMSPEEIEAVELRNSEQEERLEEIQAILGMSQENEESSFEATEETPQVGPSIRY